MLNALWIMMRGIKARERCATPHDTTYDGCADAFYLKECIPLLFGIKLYGYYFSALITVREMHAFIVFRVLW